MIMARQRQKRIADPKEKGLTTVPPLTVIVVAKRMTAVEVVILKQFLVIAYLLQRLSKP